MDPAPDSAPEARPRKTRRDFGQIEHPAPDRVNALFWWEGRRFRRACPDAKDAGKKLSAAQYALEHGRPVAEVLASVFGDPGGARSSFAEITDEYLAHAETAGTLKPSTLSGAERLYSLLKATAPWAGKRIGKVSRVDVTDWMSGRIKNDGTSVATANRYLSACSTVFRFAVSRGWATENPCRMIPRYSEAGREKGLCLTPDQSRKLLAAAPDDHFRFFLLAALETGARRGELLALRWRNVNLPAGVITFEAGTTKSRHRRDVPLTPALSKALTDAMPKDPILDGAVFTRKDGRPLSVGVIRSRFARTLDNCREGKNTLPGEILDELRFHDTRHTGTSYWLSTTGDVFRTARIVGHGSTDMIMARYGHVLASDLQKAARARGRAIKLTMDAPAGTVAGVLDTPPNTPKLKASS